MSLDSVVAVTITSNTRTPSQKGFGVPLILAHHTLGAVQRVRTYTSLTSMVTDGFSLYSGAYLAAVALKSQSPSPPKWKVGRRATPFLQQVRLTVASSVAGDEHSLTLREPTAATTHNITVTASGTAATDAAAIAFALMGATGPTGGTGPTGPISPTGSLGPTGPYGVAAYASGATVVVTTTGAGVAAAAGLLADIRDWSGNLVLETISRDPGIAADLVACAAEDPDFYGVCLDSNSAAEIAGAAAQVETMTAILAVDAPDGGDVRATGGYQAPLAGLKTLSYARTFPIYSGSRLLSYIGAATLGGRLPDTPGGTTWCHKTYAGVPVDNLPDSYVTRLEANNVNYYTYLGGVGDMRWGLVPAGEYIDKVIGCDWLRARLQERIVAKLQALPKIPYTDNGVNVIGTEIKGQLADAVKAGFLSSYTVDFPKVADISAANKAGRFLPDMRFSGVVAGAIHTLAIDGTISV